LISAATLINLTSFSVRLVRHVKAAVGGVEAICMAFSKGGGNAGSVLSVLIYILIEGRVLMPF
jgi:hypothetical protein